MILIAIPDDRRPGISGLSPHDDCSSCRQTRNIPSRRITRSELFFVGPRAILAVVHIQRCPTLYW